ncbi:MAG: hypothetical protein AB7O67_16590 [Vicinamibacterales bacterium]
MPRLKATITKAEHDALPEALRELYVENGDRFTLDAEGVEDVTGLKGALEKERKAKAELDKELRQLRKDLAGTDPAKAREALKRLQELEDKELIEAGEVEKLVEKRTANLAAEKDREIRERDEKIAAAEGRLSELLIDSELRRIATAKKIRREAVDDFVARGRVIYKLVDGKATPMKGDDVVYSAKKANEPMTMDEWADSLIPTAPHLFEGSGGGGTPPGGGGRSGGGGGVTISRANARDPQQYRAAKEQATKAGVELQIVD